MKAFIPAAGLGTRLRPFTLTNPKALVKVDGVPMLERVILRLKEEGFDDIVINLHHFGDKIEEFVKANDNFGVRIRFSDERDCLLDTGGALLHASQILGETNEPFLIHNVDILSNAQLRNLVERHEASGHDATLLVSERNSSRRLMFDGSMRLHGWHNLSTGEYKPAESDAGRQYRELAFSGIHVMSPETVFAEMERQGRSGVFSVIDFYLEAVRNLIVTGEESRNLRMIDIGKPDTLARASELLQSMSD